MMEQEARRNFAPYVAFKTFLTALEVLAQGLPNQLDRSVWPTLSGGIQSQMLSAFRFLRLIDEKGTVQPILRALVEEQERRPANLATILEAQYPKIVALARENASPKQFEDAMGELSGQGTLKKAITFFVPAAKYAGIPIPKSWQMRKKRGTGNTSRRRSAREKQESKSGDLKQRSPRTMHQEGATKIVALNSGGTVTLSIAVDLISLSVEDRKWLFELIDKLAAYGHNYDPNRPDEGAVGNN
jgi:hypothetical protein